MGEFTDAKVSRVFLEQIDGEYQGAAFPFVAGLASGVTRVLFGPDHALYVGMTSRGWSSLGTKSYGRQRVRWTGTPPFAIRAMRATAAGRLEAYAMTSYTYLYSSVYGSPEIDPRPARVTVAEVSFDRLRVRLAVECRRELHVHGLRAAGVGSAAGVPFQHPGPYHTLNRIPR